MPRATILLLISLSAVGIYGFDFRREIVIDKGDYLEICKQAPIELAIVLDASSSISRKDFQIGITFLQDFVKQYQFGTGDQGVRFSIITYGKGIYPEDGFNLTTHNSRDEVVTAISNIPHRAGLYTDTGKAIEYMHKVQLTPDIVRPNAEKISVVITDGNSQMWRFTKQAAEDARADGIKIFAIGVGTGIRDEELLNIAGDQARVVKVDNYDKLEGIKEELAKETCTIKEKPTTTPEPQTTCGELNPSDIYFVFSPADLGTDATAWTTSFISNTVDAEDLQTGFRYGVISGSCPDDQGFDLDAYSDVNDIKARLAKYDGSKTPNLVDQLITDGYTEERGAREDAVKVAVIFASGDKKKIGDLDSQVDQLVANGVRVFIADPFGTGVTAGDAGSLQGRSSREQSESFISQLCPEFNSEKVTENPCV